MDSFVSLIAGKTYVTKFREEGIPHKHPLAHVERAVVERYVLSRCQGKNIIDVGGNAVRHSKYTGVYKTSVWSNCPIIDQ